MNLIKILFCNLLFLLLLNSCAPVKFTRSDSLTVKPTCAGTSCNANNIQCSPVIDGSASTFTYNLSSSTLPSISSNCSPSDVDYLWVVRRADSSLISTPISGLSGMNPSGVNFTTLGQGTYYVFLTASQTGGGIGPFNAITPLEFIVPGPGIGNSLTCDPKLNSTLTSVTLNSADPNATITANCTPAAGSYIWTATKDGVTTTIAGLSGASSSPDIKSLGAGTYRIYLYATATGSQHWQSSTALTVIVNSPPPVANNIDCNPVINGSLTTLLLTASDANPLISANCFPTSVSYNWTVTRNGNPVSVSGLSGANSNPNFLALGVGTYQVYLNASASGYTSWNTTSPLFITVASAGAGLALNCTPRLNGTAVAAAISTSGPNPTVTSGCNPSTATHSWSVFKNGIAISISGLSGASSIPNFIASGIGVYEIYLDATASGYNAYVSPSPLVLTVNQVVTPLRHITYERVVQPTDNKVDILVVVDDSNSMAPDNSKLAQRLQGFVNDLTASGIDWQMCATVTRAQDVANNGVYFWGASRNWVNYVGSPQWILKTGAADPYSIFTSTMSAIGAGWAGTDDERGIKAAWWHVEYAQYNSCYRADASLAVIMISDEDERSVGGDTAQVYYSGELKTLEAEDQPQAYVNKIKQLFGNSKRFSFNSIIVTPGDSSCMASQDSAGSKSHYGYKYAELSALTGGAVGNICATDYSTNLYYFRDRIVNTLASVPLECAPVGDVDVVITPTMSSLSVQLVGNDLTFNPAIPVGRTIQINYDCLQN